MICVTARHDSCRITERTQSLWWNLASLLQRCNGWTLLRRKWWQVRQLQLCICWSMSSSSEENKWMHTWNFWPNSSPPIDWCKFHITSKCLLSFSSAISKVSYMSPFMICNKCYRVEVAFDVEENCTMAMFGVGVGGRGKGQERVS